MQNTEMVPMSNELMLARAGEDLDAAKKVVVRTAAESIGAQHLRAAISYKIKELTDRRMSITRKMDEAKKQVMGLFAAPISVLEQAQDAIDQEVIAFQLAEDARVREEQRKENERAAKEQFRLSKLAEKATAAGKLDKADEYQDRAAAVLPAPVAVAEATAAGTSFREVWKYRIVDVSRIKPQWMEPDETKIGNTVRSMKADAADIIGGIEVYSEKILASRRT